MDSSAVFAYALQTPYEGLVSALSSLPVESLGKLRDATDDAIAAALRGLGEVFAPAARKEYAAGVYQIGVSLPAGEYFATMTGDALLASVEVKAGPDAGAPARMVDAFTTCSIVGVSDGDVLIARGCNIEPLAFSRDYLSAAVDVPEGFYLVGFHLPAGEYEAVRRADSVACSVSVFADAGQRVALGFSLIRDDRARVNLVAGDYVKLRGVSLRGMAR